MEHKNCSIVKYDEIRHLIPEKSMYAPFNGSESEIAEEYVFYCEGDLDLEALLDLDDPLKCLIGGNVPDVFIYFILVTGNCRIRNSCNRVTDGATGLVVLGNLKADNIVVGGQEIYVVGHMTCKELFWGDYNHGNLNVEGAIRAKVLMITDYGVDFERFTSGEHITTECLLWDEIADTDDFENPEPIRSTFLPEFVAEEIEVIDDLYSWKDRLNYCKIFEALESGKPLIREKIEKESKETAIPFFFTDDAISAKNLQRFGDSNVLTGFVPQKGQEQVLEYWEGDSFYRVLVEIGQPFSYCVYVQYKQEHACMVYFSNHKGGIWERIMGKKHYKLAMAFRQFPDGDWLLLNNSAPLTYRLFLKERWKKLLEHYSEMVWYRKQFDKKVSREILESILNLPLIREKYSNYYSVEEDSRIWFRDFQWQFRQQDAEPGACPRIGIIKETQDGSFDFYHFDLIETIDGRLAPVLFTQDQNGYDAEAYEVLILEREKYKKAIRYFEILERVIFEMNKQYLQEQEDIACGKICSLLGAMPMCLGPEYIALLHHLMTNQQKDKDDPLYEIIYLCEEHNIPFLWRMDWKQEIGDLEWAIKHSLKTNFDIDVILPSASDYPEEAAISYGTVFIDFDKALHFYNLQLGFVNTQCDEYVFFIHPLALRIKLEKEFARLGYQYEQATDL